MFKKLLSSALAALLFLSAAGCSSIITVNKRLDGTPATTIEVNPDIYPPETTAPETEETDSIEEPEVTEAMTLPDGAEIVTQPAPQPLGQVVPVTLQDNFAIAKQYLDALTADDFGGVAVNIMTSDASIFMPESAGDPVDNARIERNEMVEEKYNTRIIAIDTPVSEIYANTRLAVMSGDYYTDLIAVPQNWLGSFAMSGLLLNLRSLPFTNYKAPYFDADAMAQTTTQFNVWGAYGDLNESPNYFYCLFFNKSLIESLGLQSPYALAYNDEWTQDKFREFCLAAKNAGYYGFGAQLDEDAVIDALFASSGENYFTTSLGRIPAQRTVTANVSKLVERMRNLIYKDGVAFDGGTGSYTPNGARAAFYSGKMLFYVDHTYMISAFSDMNDDWGVLPLPKNTASQTYYYSYVDRTMPVLAVIKNSATAKNAGLFLQAANAASYNFIEDVWYDELARDVIRDGDTLNMLDIVLGRSDKGRTYVDFAVNFGEALPYIGDAGYKLMRSCVKTGRDYAAAVKAVMPDVAKMSAEKFETKKPAAAE
ncbi:MAG: extracellular solute-binding protein [Clostridiales bacterium]|nr:extracellular solute-binding protein [Clostridiales bacterium]